MTPLPSPAGDRPWQARCARNQWLRRYLASQWRLLALGAACLIATNAMALSIPWIVKGAIEEIRSQSASTLHQRALLVVAAALLSATVRTLSRTLIYAAGREVEYTLRNDLTAHLVRLPLSRIRGGRQGDFLSRASSDASDVRVLLGPGFLQLFNASLTYTTTIAVMFALDPLLAALSVLPFPVLLVVFSRMARRIHALSTRIQQQLGAISARLAENLAGAMIVRCYGLQRRESDELSARSREYLEQSLAQARLRSTVWPLVTMISGAGSVLLLALGGSRVASGQIPLGTLVAFLSYHAYLLGPTIGLGWISNAIQRGLAAADRIHEVWQMEPEPRVECEAPPGPVRGELELRSLTFAYPGQGSRSPVLSDVTLRIPAGAHVALLGRTGAGKSTLLALVVRLLEPPPGSVLLDGKDVTGLPLPWLRHAVALVPQEPFLFSRTVQENLLYAAPGANPAEARLAAEQARLAPDVAGFPLGWDTPVGEAGITLSRGQRQRAALARALVTRPPVLLLDDTFSAVDTGTEESILSELASLRRGRTTVLVTHRASTASLASHVVVVDGGRVVEEGPPGGLLSSGGYFTHLAERQRLEALLGDEAS